MKRFIYFFLLCVPGIVAAQSKIKSITAKAARDLIPEGIAVHKNTIYISSINRHVIVAIDEQGNAKNFIFPEQDGFLEGLGVKVDTARGLLWALSVRKDSNLYTSQIHGFTLADGKTTYHHKLQDTVPHLFNDLVIGSDGTLYITDTYGGALYSYVPATDSLAVFFKSPSLSYPNGLTFGNNNRLYIATYRNGLMQLDLGTKDLQQLNGYNDSTIARGLDGLVFWNNSIIGVYNVGKTRATNAVVQYQLDSTGQAITNEILLDRGNPAFYEPTTAALSGNNLYLLANSHLAAYNENKTSTLGIERNLLPPVILIYELK